MAAVEEWGEGGGTWTTNGGRACLLFLIGRNILAGACTTWSVPLTAGAGEGGVGPARSVLGLAAFATLGLGCTRKNQSAASDVLKSSIGCDRPEGDTVQA